MFCSRQLYHVVTLAQGERSSRKNGMWSAIDGWLARYQLTLKALVILCYLLDPLTLRLGDLCSEDGATDY